MSEMASRCLNMARCISVGMERICIVNSFLEKFQRSKMRNVRDVFGKKQKMDGFSSLQELCAKIILEEKFLFNMNSVGRELPYHILVYLLAVMTPDDFLQLHTRYTSGAMEEEAFIENYKALLDSEEWATCYENHWILWNRKSELQFLAEQYWTLHAKDAYEKLEKGEKLLHKEILLQDDEILIAEFFSRERVKGTEISIFQDNMPVQDGNRMKNTNSSKNRFVVRLPVCSFDTKTMFDQLYNFQNIRHMSISEGGHINFPVRLLCIGRDLYFLEEICFLNVFCTSEFFTSLSNFLKCMKSKSIIFSFEDCALIKGSGCGDWEERIGDTWGNLVGSNCHGLSGIKMRDTYKCGIWVNSIWRGKKVNLYPNWLDLYGAYVYMENSQSKACNPKSVARNWNGLVRHALCTERYPNFKNKLSELELEGENVWNILLYLTENLQDTQNTAFMTSLRLRSVAICCSTFSALRHWRFSRLTLLDISGTKLGYEGAALLAEHAIFWPVVKRIQLTNCNIPSSGFSTLLPAMLQGSGCKNLTILDISQNEVDQTGLEMLGDFFTCSNLNQLRFLYMNQLFSSRMGLPQQFLNGIKSLSLFELDMWGSKSDPVSAHKLFSVIFTPSNLKMKHLTRFSYKCIWEKDQILDCRSIFENTQGKKEYFSLPLHKFLKVYEVPVNSD